MISCQSKTTTEPKNQKSIEDHTEPPKKRVPLWTIGQDTILEKNNPKNLDLSKHQLFIDTTRNSEFYEAYYHWEPHKFYIHDTDHYIKEISKKHPIKTTSIGNFPDTWITLEKLNNEFVVYDKCDAISRRYFIAKNAIHIYNIEGDSDLIYEVRKRTDTEIIIETRVISQKSESEKGIFSIKKTNFDYVYILICSYENWETKSLVTPLKHLNKFDLVVNHCVQTKRLEFNGFDKINFDEY